MQTFQPGISVRRKMHQHTQSRSTFAVRLFVSPAWVGRTTRCVQLKLCMGDYTEYYERRWVSAVLAKIGGLTQTKPHDVIALATSISIGKTGGWSKCIGWMSVTSSRTLVIGTEFVTRKDKERYCPDFTQKRCHVTAPSHTSVVSILWGRNRWESGWGLGRIWCAIFRFTDPRPWLNTVKVNTTVIIFITQDEWMLALSLLWWWDHSHHLPWGHGSTRVLKAALKETSRSTPLWNFQSRSRTSTWFRSLLRH